jgi:Tfp pilus assembly protein PilX
MPATLLERLRRQDKGTLLVEATVCLGIAGILGLGVTNAQLQADRTQRNSANFNIAVQTAQGMLEKAKATPWQQLGTTAAESPVGDSMLPAGVTSVRTGKLNPKTVDPVRNLELTTLVAVGWAAKPVGASTYGTKVVIVKTTWQDVKGDAARTFSHTEQTTITPGVGEAPPSSVRGADGGASVVTPPPVAPAPAPTYSAPPVPAATAPPEPVASPTPAPTPTPPPAPVQTPIDVYRSTAAWLGNPTGPETGGLPRGGRYRNYEGGQVIWQPDIGAVGLHKGTGFTVRFNNEGGVTGTFGYPVGDEFFVRPVQESYQKFENGTMFWQNGVATTWMVNGPILDYYQKNGGQTGWLGIPVNEKRNLRDGGSVQSFEQGAAMYYSPNAGPSIMNGALLTAYGNMGWENSLMGYPIGTEYGWNSKVRHDFENGYMLWNPSNGVVTVH